MTPAERAQWANRRMRLRRRVVRIMDRLDLPSNAKHEGPPALSAVPLDAPVGR